mmetsp:Transcript_8471/g.14026  ORF Transcript_8471/g.14026 Transcript_8471/m.14026 type:complete len:587 (+) Transcript_8471:76-1836(+)
MTVEEARALPVAPDVEGDITPSEEPAEEEAKPLDRRTQFQHPQAEESVHDISYHPGIVQFYCPVTQRQKWGDSQILPRVNWGDTFFDLFFVAAAYNVGNILVGSPNARGFLYFVGCFFPAMQMWRDKMYYDSRFVVGDDIFHRVFEAITFLVGAGGIVHIGPVEVMSNPREHPDMFAFALVLTVFSFMNFFGYLEVYFFGVGQPKVLKQVTLRDSLTRILPFGLNLAATVIAGVEYFINGAGGRDEKEEGGYADTAYDEKDDDHRILAAGAADPSEEAYVNDLPIYLCFGAYWAFFALLVLAVQFLFPRDGSHKNFTIPMNIAFVIHRDGEWIMLMLGESILSLLIVDITENDEYYTTFFCGILTIIALQYLHYRSQPHDPNLHAMRRDKDAGIWWGFTNGVYSCALIGVGVSYKLFLYEFTYDARRLEEEEYRMEGRVLAGADSGTGSIEERQQAAANIFSAAMATVFFTLDIMILFHRGLWFSMGRCKCRHTKKKYKGVLLTIARIALCVFFATLSLYENDPDHLAVLGLAGVFAQLIIRKIGSVLFAEEADGGKQKKIDPEETKWPNVTHAVAEHTKDATTKA